MKIQLKKDAHFRNAFKQKPSIFRIEAVIHDGQWYDPEKWSEVSYTTKAEVESYIQQHKDILIERNGSYRVNIEEIVRWYQEHGLNLEEPLVPNNFIPKLWGGKTETQHFIDTPKRLINILTIDCYDFETRDVVKNALQGYGKTTDLDNKPAIRVYTLSTEYIEEHLKRTLEPALYRKLTFRKRHQVLWRDLSEFDEVFLQEALHFYTHYAKGLLKPHSKTLEIFVPFSYDREIQIQEWILRAIDKFDENNNVPFSGYLANVLQRWPYDLPNDELGIELARFQRERHKAILSLVEETSSELQDEEDIRLLTTYNTDDKKSDYYRLLEEHQNWVNFKTATTLNWAEKNEEKTGKSIFKRNAPENTQEHTKAYFLTLNLFSTALQTGDYESLSMILDNYTEKGIANLEVSEDFKKVLWEKLHEQTL